MGRDMNCWQELANAVVLQAAKDYREALCRLKKHPDDGYSIKTKKECEKFFLSQRFDVFTDLDGKALMEKIRKEVMEDEVHTA